MTFTIRPFRMSCFFTAILALPCGLGRAQQHMVPSMPPPDAKVLDFRDGHFGVEFQVPEGWTLNRKDGEVSTFHLDARSASPKAQLRSVATIGFNPYPYSTFSGALFYYSVERHTTDEECARQASGPNPERSKVSVLEHKHDVQDIDGMNFAHGHDEHGDVCVEARDEVYTAFRRGSCYRFDLAMNTFCAISSGAMDVTDGQVEEIDQRMADILSTVKLNWTKEGPHPVPAPKLPEEPEVVPGRSTMATMGRGAS